ncbi:MAG: hypothetical protein ABH824_02975 [Nanoarchaeota archaeon]|nr:hypothetical protein [Patescibacteria group bacterium]MBU1875551.1 hypothetical protein [Nanoarchaeota archaeon]
MVGVGFSTLVQYFQSYGVVDFLLPFILVFTLIYAVTANMPLFKDHKNFRVIIALVLGLLFVIPHMIGTYPLGYDPVQVMNDSLPSISLVAVAAMMLLLLLGIFGKGFSQSASPLIALTAVGFVIYIFGSSLNLWAAPYDVFYWWTSDVTELMLIILVFGLIVWFITKEPGKGSMGNTIKDVWKGVGGFLEDIGKK